MKLKGSIVKSARPLLTTAVGVTTFLAAANADNPGKPLPQQFSDTLARMVGKDLANMILVPMGLPGSGLAQKLNPLGFINKYSVGGAVALVAIHYAGEYAPAGAKKYLPYASAIATGLLAGGFAGGFFDDPPGAHGNGHAAHGVSAAVAQLSQASAYGARSSAAVPMTTSGNLWGTK